MNSRQRTEKKTFTPSSTPEPNSFLCQLIDTNDFIIIHRSSIKRLYDNTAEIILNGRRTEVFIQHQGMSFFSEEMKER